MDLAPEQYFVYAWRYMDDAVCKLGVGTLRSFYARIKAAKTVTYQDIELLGIEVFGTEAEARTAYRQRLETFARVADRRAWVHFDAVVRQWLATECMSNPPTLDAFKDAFQNDPVRREKEREYQQRRSSQKRTTRKPRRNPVRNARRRIALMSGNMLGSGGKMTLHIRRNRKNVRRRGDRRTRIMIQIGMRLTRNTRRVGRRRVGNGMRMILSIGRWRSNGGGSLHRIIRSIGRSGGCICGSIVGGRRRRRNSFQWRIGLTKPSHKEKVLPQESSLLPKIVLESGLQSPPTREFPPTEDSIRIGLTKPSHKRVPKIVLESGFLVPSYRR